MAWLTRTHFPASRRQEKESGRRLASPGEAHTQHVPACAVAQERGAPAAAAAVSHLPPPAAVPQLQLQSGCSGDPMPAQARVHGQHVTPPLGASGHVSGCEAPAPSTAPSASSAARSSRDASGRATNRAAAGSRSQSGGVREGASRAALRPLEALAYSSPGRDAQGLGLSPERAKAAPAADRKAANALASKVRRRL